MAVLTRILALAIAAGALLAVACGNEAPGDAPVLATTAVIAALAKPVAGDLLPVRAMVAPGVDPHEFEPKPADVRLVKGAKLILRNGIGLDAFLDKIVSGSKARVVTVTDGLTLRADTDDRGQKTEDPHVWHSAENDRLIVAKIAEAFAELDPPNAAKYRENARVYQERLEAVDREIRQQIATVPPERRKMVTDHYAFGYYIDRYGLRYVGAVIPSTSTSAEPSAKDLAALTQTIRAEGVPAIFAESSVDPKVARRIAQDTGVRIVDDLYGDSVGVAGSGAESVDGMLLANTKKIVEALRP
jgi:ABC-type Zn uptake system ZnuABC Zn-binding protein ZnuA